MFELIRSLARSAEIAHSHKSRASSANEISQVGVFVCLANVAEHNKERDGIISIHIIINIIFNKLIIDIKLRID